MGKYSIYEDDPVDERIEQDLATIVQEILKEFQSGDIRAIILVGGFGRGEGSVLVDRDLVMPVNDYDLAVISRYALDRKRIESMRRQLAKLLGISWVDITQHRPSELSRLPFTMYNYDLKESGRVVFGDETGMSLIPVMRPQDMPLYEAERQFFTRLWCFLAAFSYDMLTQPPQGKAPFFLINQLSKAILACSDAVLIAHGKYHYSYAERLRRLQQILPDDSDLLESAKWATSFKLRPTKTISVDPVQLWFDCRHHFLSTMRWFAEIKHGRRFSNWPLDYISYYLRSWDTVKRRLWHLLAYRTREYERWLQVQAAELCIVAALSRNGVSEELLDRGKRHLRKVAGDSCSLMTWDEARALAARLRLEL